MGFEPTSIVQTISLPDCGTAHGLSCRMKGRGLEGAGDVGEVPGDPMSGSKVHIINRLKAELFKYSVARLGGSCQEGVSESRSKESGMPSRSLSTFITSSLRALPGYQPGPEMCLPRYQRSGSSESREREKWRASAAWALCASGLSRRNALLPSELSGAARQAVIASMIGKPSLGRDSQGAAHQLHAVRGSRTTAFRRDDGPATELPIPDRKENPRIKRCRKFLDK